MTKNHPEKPVPSIRPEGRRNLGPSNELHMRGTFHYDLEQRNGDKYNNKLLKEYTFLLC